jgi:predicted MFS family arabinose efflux permease
VILVSLAGNAASMVLFALATWVSLLPLLFASRILAGATAGNISACQAAIADVTEGEERARGMGRLGAGIGLGLVLGPALGGLLSRFGMWAPPLGAAAMAVADLIAAFFVMPETHPPGHRATASAASGGPALPSSLVEMLSQRRVVIVLGLYFCTFLYMTTMQVALALLVKQRLGWDAPEVGKVFALFGAVGLIVQGWAIGWIAKRFGQVRVVTAGSLLSAAGLMGIAMAYHFVPLVGGLVALAFGLGVTQPMLSSIASEYAGNQQRGAILGFAQSSGGLARTVGPVISGYLFDALGAGAPFAGGAVAAVIAFALTLGLMRSRRETITAS